MSVRSCHCPRCGGSVDEQARRCGYCDAAVATVRCAGCFHMSSADAAYCAGCGRELGLEPIAEDDALRCPDCKEVFAAFRAPHGVLRDCGRCGGQFVEQALLRDLLERREVYGVAAPRHEARPVWLDGRVRYVPCPVCAQMMNRKNFAGASGVIVDVCRKHGVWFDQGELPRVLAFAESGGLARARRRQVEELARVRRDAVTTTIASATVGTMTAPSNRSGLELAVVDLLDFVIELTQSR